MSEPLPCVELEPAGETKHVVLWLHGLGADGHDFEPIVPHLGIPPELGVRFVFPNAPRIPVTANGGMVMPAWYDIEIVQTAQGLDFTQDEDGVRASAARIRDLLEREAARGVPAERIVLAGFSQGGAIALFEGLRHPHRLAGILALSTYLVGEDSLDAEAHEQNRDTPILQAHGTMDPVVALGRGTHARDALRARGHQVDWHDYPMQHEVCMEEIEAIGAWLRQRFG